MSACFVLSGGYLHPRMSGQTPALATVAAGVPLHWARCRLFLEGWAQGSYLYNSSKGRGPMSVPVLGSVPDQKTGAVWGSCCPGPLG